jgi:hypothetical protein
VKVQFVLGAGLSSRLIAWWGQGYNGWSHVDAVLSDGSLAGARSDVIRPLGGGPAIPAGCQIRPPRYEKWKRRTVMEKKSSPDDDALWDNFFRTRAGHAQYDEGDILGFILGSDHSQDGHWICSAWNLDGAETLDLVPSIEIPVKQVSPNTLAAIYSATGWLITEDEIL